VEHKQNLQLRTVALCRGGGLSWQFKYIILTMFWNRSLYVACTRRGKITYIGISPHTREIFGSCCCCCILTMFYHGCQVTCSKTATRNLCSRQSACTRKVGLASDSSNRLI